MIGRLVVLALAGGLLATTAARANDPIRCSCSFGVGAGYSAVGTRAVCSAFTKDKACTIAFGGLGAQDQKLSELGVDIAAYRDSALKLTLDNLDALRLNARERLANPQVLQNAIVVYMRAAYLRQELDLDGATLRDLDEQVQRVSKEFAAPIADVFAGRSAPFAASWAGQSRIEVQRGAVRFVYRERAVVVAVFFK